MNAVLGLGLFSVIIYLFIKFARQEYAQDDFDDAIVDIEGRLDWARTRSFFPFGMKSQIEVASELLKKAKRLWGENKWHQAYDIACQSQEALNKAQSIYTSGIKISQR